MSEQPKILIVDDAEFSRKMLANILGKAGYIDIQEAKNGKEALEVYQRQKPDMIFLDLLMPEMDGMEVIKQIGPGEASIIVLSAVGQRKIVQKALSLGAKAFITKPYREEEVLEAIKKFSQ